MKRTLIVAALSAVAFADNVESPTGNRTTPPTIAAVSPRGISRGTTAEVTIEGLNLGKAQKIYFDQPGVTGKILRVKELPDASDVRLGSNGGGSTTDPGPLPPRHPVTAAVEG